MCKYILYLKKFFNYFPVIFNICVSSPLPLIWSVNRLFFLLALFQTMIHIWICKKCFGVSFSEWILLGRHVSMWHIYIHMYIYVCFRSSPWVANFSSSLPWLQFSSLRIPVVHILHLFSLHCVSVTFSWNLLFLL